MLCLLIICLFVSPQPVLIFSAYLKLCSGYCVLTHNWNAYMVQRMYDLSYMVLEGHLYDSYGYC